MTDFAADESFAAAVEKVQEHYGLVVPASAVRVLTLAHAQEMSERPLEEQLPPMGVAQLIAEMDGSMVPIVTLAEATTPETTKDKRKGWKTEWKQARLLVVRKASAVTKLYNATLGSAQAVGEQLLDAAIGAGGGQTTQVHGLGDGAPWIVAQIEEQFAERGGFLIDFYHLSQYLASAAEAIAGIHKKDWLARQQEKMKQSRVAEVIEELRRRREQESEPQKQESILACERYLSNRLKYLDYAAAIKAGLPIGSGEVESGHRSVIQKRLKISGAWWKIDNAEKMLALRVLRANGGWQSYWDSRRQAAA